MLSLESLKHSEEDSINVFMVTQNQIPQLNNQLCWIIIFDVTLFYITVLSFICQPKYETIES